MLLQTNGTAAPAGSYYIRSGEEWFPQAAIVVAGVSEIPLTRLIADVFLLHEYMKLGVGGSKLVQCHLGDADILPTKVEQVSAVVGQR